MTTKITMREWEKAAREAESEARELARESATWGDAIEQFNAYIETLDQTDGRQNAIVYGYLRVTLECLREQAREMA